MAFKIKRILVPLDGSSNSFRGLDVAIHMARQIEKSSEHVSFSRVINDTIRNCI